MTNPLQGLLRRSTLFGGATARNRLYGWAGAALCIVAVNSAQALDANYAGFSYSTAAQAGKTCLQIDSLVTLNSANITAREALVTACASETRPLSTGGERRDYQYSDSGGTPYYFGPYYYNYPGKGGGPALISEADAISGCQNSRAAYVAALDQSLRTNHFVCWSPTAYVTVGITSTAPTDDANSTSTALATLSGKTSLVGNWVRASAVINNDLASVVLTEVDWKPNAAAGVCLDANGAGGAITQTCNAGPNWSTEPTALANVLRLRLGRSTGQCLELDAATAALTVKGCRARNDALFNNQAWQLSTTGAGNKLIQSKSSTPLCLTYNNGGVVAQTCPANITTATPQQLWQMAQPIYGQEHWNAITEYKYYDANRRTASFVAAAVQPANTSPISNAPSGFVALSEPTASTMPVYRGAGNSLYLCNDNAAACGEIAFYTVLPPALTTTPSATDALRVPVYEFTATDSSATGYRYSTSLDIGYGWVRQPNIAFFAYKNLTDTSARVQEVVDAVNRVISGGNITAPQLGVVNYGYVGYEYYPDNNIVFISSSSTENPDREELLHVMGHVLIDAILGPLASEDQCLYSSDTSSSSAFHRPRDILNADWQSDACLFREGWAESFTNQMLVGKTSLANFPNNGGVLFDSDGVWQSPGRRQLNPLLIAFASLGPVAPEALVVLFAVQWYLNSQPLNPLPNPSFESIGQAATIAMPTSQPEWTLRDHIKQRLSADSNAAKQAYNTCKVAEGRYDSTAASCDFKAYLEDDTTSMCQVIPTTGAWSFKDCRTPQRILCFDATVSGDVFKLTTPKYPLLNAVEACVTEFGAKYQPITHSKKRTRSQYGLPTNVVAGTGEAQEPPSKALKSMPVGTALGSVTATKTALAPVLADTDYNYLLVHSLNVGAGSCHIVQCVGEKSAFVDCGSSGSNLPVLNAPAVIAYAQDMGIFADPHPTVVVAHPHRDHYNYVTRVFGNRTPDTIWMGASYDGYLNPFYNWVNAFLSPANTISVNGSTTQQQIWPPAAHLLKTFPSCGGATLNMVTVNTGGILPGNDSKNRNSAVLEVELHDATGNIFAAVIPGDATVETENAAIAALGAPLNHSLMRFMAASHHGSSDSNTANWINQVRPTRLVYSAGSRYRHPRCDVLARYTAAGTLIVATNHDLECGVDNDNFQLQTVANGQYSTRASGNVVAGVAIRKAAATKPGPAYIPIFQTNQ